MAIETLSRLRERANEVVRTLGWEVYHTPENLTLFLLVEAAELGEYCQWLSKDKVVEPGLIDHVFEEIADVVKCVLYLANVIHLSTPLEVVLIEKLKLDAQEYPVHHFKGKSRYQVLRSERRKGKIPDIPGGESPDIIIVELQQMAWNFVRERNWEQFYTPASLALAIAVKGGEVATSYQRRPKPIERPYQRMVWALADILLNAMRLCELLSIINLHQVVLNKLDADERRFAVPPEA